MKNKKIMKFPKKTGKNSISFLLGNKKVFILVEFSG